MVRAYLKNVNTSRQSHITEFFVKRSHVTPHTEIRGGDELRISRLPQSQLKIMMKRYQISHSNKMD